MWPMLLDMSKRECKNELRRLELEAYSVVVSTFRAQGNLNQAKIQILKELETFFKISPDRSKAELRRACNDEKLYTIAKKLSHGESVTSEWITQSKRLIPLLPRLQQTNKSSAPSYYRILADHILKNSKPILKLYSNPSETIKREHDSEMETVVDDTKEKLDVKINKKASQRLKKKIKEEEETQIQAATTEPINEDTNILYLANGYAVSSNLVQIKTNKPSEFIKEYETNEDEDNSFLKNLILKYKKQKEEKQHLEQLFLNEANKKLEPQPTEIKTTNKNSKLISQMIEAKKTQETDTKIVKTVIAVPSTAAKISPTAQIIRLDSSSVYNSMTQKATSSISLLPSNSQPNNTSTIVKLTTSSISNHLNGQQSNSSFGQLLNLNNQNLKHFVLPKTNQKLIILPTNSNNIPNNLNTTLKKNYLISSNTTSTLNNSLKVLSQENSEKNNLRIISSQNGHTNLNQSSIQKVILYKSSPNQHSTLKITNNDTVANLNDNLEMVTLNQQKTVDSEKKLDDEPKINNSFEQDENTESSDDQFETSLKRKRTFVESNRQKMIKIENNNNSNSESFSSSSLSASPSDWCETNLQLINDMLDRLNKQDVDTKKDLIILCENIKDKLERNAYECIDDLNSDLKFIYTTDKHYDDDNKLVNLNHMIKTDK